jgi:hypothetical protein
MFSPKRIGMPVPGSQNPLGDPFKSESFEKFIELKKKIDKEKVNDLFRANYCYKYV